MEEVETSDSQKKKLCTLSDSDGTLSDDGPSIILWDLDKLRPYEGTIDFHVHRMNVQGGGILSKNQLISEAFSMKWLDPVTENEDEEDGFQIGFQRF